MGGLNRPAACPHFTDQLIMPDSTNNKVAFSGADSYLRAALSGLAARQRTIANNVANVDTPNFKASEVRFEDALKTAISRGRPGSAPDQAALNAAASRASLTDATSTRADGNNVDIDREMEMLSEANLTYSALTQVMSARISILRNVITGR
jgi:flagellar basal-body rod protein FlgB